MAKSLPLVSYVNDMESAYPLFSNAASVDSDFLDKLRRETLTYKNLADKIEAPFYAKLDKGWTNLDDYTEKVLVWWRDIGSVNIPTWATAACAVFSMAPTSAVPERIFSIAAATLGEGHDNALHDLIEATLMRRFNELQKKREDDTKRKRKAR